MNAALAALVAVLAFFLLAALLIVLAAKGGLVNASLHKKSQPKEKPGA